MLAITVDVEDWYHIPSVTGSTFSKYRDVDDFFSRWKGRYDYLTKPTKKVLDLLDKYHVRATFFVVADVTEHYPGLVEEISARGHEIACHGLHHACKINPETKLPLISQSHFEAQTHQAKQILEKASGQNVLGYRAPAAYVSGWMLDSLEKLGFKYDSSVNVNSFFNKSDSKLRGVSSSPYFPEKGSLMPGKTKRSILEIPWPYFQFLVKFPTAGGPMLRLLGAQYTLAGIKQSIKRGDTVFYFHPIDISEEKFPNSFSWHRPFYWIIKGDTVQNKVESILKGVNRSDFVTCKIISSKSGNS